MAYQVGENYDETSEAWVWDTAEKGSRKLMDWAQVLGLLCRRRSMEKPRICMVGITRGICTVVGASWT